MPVLILIKIPNNYNNNKKSLNLYLDKIYNNKNKQLIKQIQILKYKNNKFLEKHYKGIINNPNNNKKYKPAKILINSRMILIIIINYFKMVYLDRVLVRIFNKNKWVLIII